MFSIRSNETRDLHYIRTHCYGTAPQNFTPTQCTALQASKKEKCEKN